VNQSASKQPNRGQFTVLRQICQLITPHLVPKVARETGVDEKSRTCSSWSHVVTMLYAQISHALSLNDVCDALRLRVGSLFMVRAARPPAKNTLRPKDNPCSSQPLGNGTVHTSGGRSALRIAWLSLGNKQRRAVTDCERWEPRRAIALARRRSRAGG